MVKKCFGSILLPEKHSLLYLSMFLRRNCLHWTKTEDMGEGEKSQLLLNAGASLAAGQHRQGPNRTRGADLRESHAEGLPGRGTAPTAFSPGPRVRKGNPQHRQGLFLKGSPIPSNFPENTPDHTLPHYPVHRCERMHVFSVGVTRNLDHRTQDRTSGEVIFQMLLWTK